MGEKQMTPDEQLINVCKRCIENIPHARPRKTSPSNLSACVLFICDECPYVLEFELIVGNHPDRFKFCHLDDGIGVRWLRWIKPIESRAPQESKTK